MDSEIQDAAYRLAASRVMFWLYDRPSKVIDMAVFDESVRDKVDDVISAHVGPDASKPKWTGGPTYGEYVLEKLGDSASDVHSDVMAHVDSVMKGLGYATPWGVS